MDIKTSKDMLTGYKAALSITIRQKERAILLQHNTTKLKNKIRMLKRFIENLERNGEELDKIKERQHYTALIKHNSANAEHAVIIYSNSGNAPMQIYNHSYEEKVMFIHKEDIYYIKLIRELEEMNY